ncbi:unnamed protein product [Arabidopsis halleri]
MRCSAVRVPRGGLLHKSCRSIGNSLSCGKVVKG